MINHPNRNRKVSAVEAVSDGKDIFIVCNGVKIAKRGRSGTKHAKTWISLDPGFVVRSFGDYSTLEIEINGVRVH